MRRGIPKVWIVDAMRGVRELTELSAVFLHLTANSCRGRTDHLDPGTVLPPSLASVLEHPSRLAQSS